MIQGKHEKCYEEISVDRLPQGKLCELKRTLKVSFDEGLFPSKALVTFHIESSRTATKSALVRISLGN